MPSSEPSTLTNWWCNMDTEYAFMGFSYEITACQPLSQLEKEFSNIRTQFKGRYVRLYGFCDNKGYYDDIVTAAWKAGLGVHALIWFGFDGDNKWMARRDNLLGTLHSNPKAKFVTRAVQFGSEPLFDSVLQPSDLATQVLAAKANLSSLQIPITVSDMAWSYQKNTGTNFAKPVRDAVDFFNVHMLPFFSASATTGDAAWPLVTPDINWFVANGENKKIYLSENAWPWTTGEDVEPNSPNAVASIKGEQDYFSILNTQCPYFKKTAGGIGWFFHIYSDSQEPQYGLFDVSGKIKFPFAPKTSC